jgi:hypothetical protein
MSLLSANLRLFARLPSFIRVSRMNVTTTASNTTNRVPVPTRTDPTYFRAGALIVGVAGLYALFRASRKEEQLIEHSTDNQHEPPVAVSSK